MVLLIRPGVSGITFSAAVFIIISGDFETWLAKSQRIPYLPVRNTMNHCLFKAKDTKGAVGNTVDYSSLTLYEVRKGDKRHMKTYTMRKAW